MKRIKILTTIAMAVAVTISITACGSSSSSNSTNKTVTASKQAKSTIEASGTVKSSHIEDLVIDTTTVPKVTKIDVTEGQVVKKGDKLVELDLGDINAAIEQAQSAVDADVQAKNADIQQKNAAEEQKNIDNISKNSATTDDQKNTINAKINADSDTISGYDAKIKADDAKIAADRSQLNALTAKLGKTYLKSGSLVSDLDNAVVTGVSSYSIGDAYGSASAAAASGSSYKGILELQDLNSLYIQANVSEEFIKDVAVGKAVKITPTANSSKKLIGKVTSISNVAVTQNGDTYILVSISIDNNNGTVLPNYNVDVEISK